MVCFKVWLSDLWLEKTSEVPLLKFKGAIYRTTVSRNNNKTKQNETKSKQTKKPKHTHTHTHKMPLN